MSTFAGIIVNRDDGTYVGTTVHYDGFVLDGVGEALLQVAPTYEQALALVELGELHSIKPDKVNAWHRDFGTSWVRVAPLFSEDLIYLEHVLECRFAQFFYFFKDGKWFYWKFKEGSREHYICNELKQQLQNEREEMQREKDRSEKFEIAIYGTDVVIRIGVDRMKSLIEGGSK